MNNAAVGRLVTEMMDVLDTLSRFPTMGKERPEYRRETRSFSVGNYTILYTPLADGVEVRRIRHQHRNPPSR